LLDNSEKNKGGPAKLNFSEAKQNVFKCFRKYELRDSVEDIFNNPKIDDAHEKSCFWLMSTALHRFY